jgi:hypothetical protein
LRAKASPMPLEAPVIATTVRFKFDPPYAMVRLQLN